MKQSNTNTNNKNKNKTSNIITMNENNIYNK